MASVAVRIDETLYSLAKAEAQSEHRSIASQLEFWAKVGKSALDNPDLPIEFIAELLKTQKTPLSAYTVFEAEIA
ncbi:MAG: ParD-like family protein [Proteobacteria bacterium]|nr:ParD-like family protein [Pseudomonadota bacterium]